MKKNLFILSLGVSLFLNLASNPVAHAESDEKKPGYIYIKNELYVPDGSPFAFTNSIKVEIDRMAFQNSDCYYIHESFRHPSNSHVRLHVGGQVVKDLNPGSTPHQIQLEGNSHDHLGNACRFNVYITANDRVTYSDDQHVSHSYSTTISCGSNFQPGDHFRVYSYQDFPEYRRTISCEKVND